MGTILGGLLFGFGRGAHYANRARVIKTKRNRYYSFRNLQRLRALKRWNLLLVLLHVCAVIFISVGIVAFTVWLLLVFFSLGQYSLKEFLDWSLYGLLGGFALLTVSMVFHWVIEFFYMRAERAELLSVPEGGEKYLRVMAATNKLKLWNLIFVIISLVVVAIFVFSGFNESVGIAAAVLVCALWVASRIMLRSSYNKVAGEISEIKAERRENKKAMIE